MIGACLLHTQLAQMSAIVHYETIFTVRNEVAKVMFLHLCVCPQGGMPGLGDGGSGRGRWPGPGGGCLVPGGPGPGGAWSQGRYLVLGVPGLRGVPALRGPGPWGVLGPGGVLSQHALRQTPPPPSYCCGRYVSYWNAFLYEFFSTQFSFE